MQKDFLDELIDALQALKSESKTITLSVPVPPHKVLKAIGETAANHNITAEELQAVLGLRNATNSDLELLQELKNREK